MLNLETTVAVTQNFVNSKNFEFVCLDMAPGYRHKGVVRAGLLALDDISIEDVRKNMLSLESGLSYSDLSRKDKRIRVDQPRSSEDGSTIDWVSKGINSTEVEFSYDINFLAMFLDKEQDHYTSLWSSSNSIGQREMREWLSKLWVEKPETRDLIWKVFIRHFSACLWLVFSSLFIFYQSNFSSQFMALITRKRKSCYFYQPSYDVKRDRDIKSYSKARNLE